MGRLLNVPRASTLVLPYDPTFSPEINLPGINIDFSLFDLTANGITSQQPRLWTNSPLDSQFSTTQIEVIQLELPPDDVLQDSHSLVSDADVRNSALKRGPFGKNAMEDPENEEGVLLQPDFEFDENGNIIEFDVTRLSPRKRRKYNMNQPESEGHVSEKTGECGVSIVQDGFEAAV